VGEQLPKLPELMQAYRDRDHGDVPFLGKLTGFKFVRMNDYYEFDASGRLSGTSRSNLDWDRPGWSFCRFWLAGRDCFDNILAGALRV
jgi:hypothetical protein